MKTQLQDGPIPLPDLQDGHFFRMWHPTQKEMTVDFLRACREYEREYPTHAVIAEALRRARAGLHLSVLHDVCLRLRCLQDKLQESTGKGKPEQYRAAVCAEVIARQRAILDRLCMSGELPKVPGVDWPALVGAAPNDLHAASRRIALWTEKRQQELEAPMTLDELREFGKQRGYNVGPSREAFAERLRRNGTKPVILGKKGKGKAALYAVGAVFKESVKIHSPGKLE